MGLKVNEVGGIIRLATSGDDTSDRHTLDEQQRMLLVGSWSLGPRVSNKKTDEGLESKSRALDTPAFQRPERWLGE